MPENQEMSVPPAGSRAGRPAEHTTGRPVPGWAQVAGWLSLLMPLPAVLWRVAMLAGVDVGFADAGQFRSSAGGIGYVLTLEIVSVLAAILCFGLIRPWGERVPGWLPGAGRAIPRWLPLALGTIGLVVMVILLGQTLADIIAGALGASDAWQPYAGMSPGQMALWLACYIPFYAWPIAVAVALIGYGLRRRPAGR